MLRIALKSLREDPNIIIAKANKGDTAVIMDSAHYHSLASKHLGDSSTYEILEVDPFAEIALDCNHFLNRCLEDKVLDKYRYHKLVIPDNYKISTIYFLPK